MIYEEQNKATFISLNMEQLRLLVYKNFILEFILSKMNESACAIIEFFIFNYCTSKNQLLANFQAVESFFNRKFLKREDVVAAYDKLADEGFIVPFKEINLEMGEDDNLEVVDGKEFMKEIPQQMKVLNLAKIYHFIRGFKFEKFMAHETNQVQAAVGFAILNSSSLFGKCAVIKKSERYNLTQIKESLSVYQPFILKSPKLNEEFLKIVLTPEPFFISEGESQEVCLNMDVLASNIKINLVEDHLTQSLSRDHVRVLRAVSILKLHSLAVMDEMLLLNKSDLRIILHDLEKMNLVRKIHFHENIESYEYHENVAAFTVELAGTLLKIVKNLYLIKERTAKEESDESGAEDLRLRMLKAESAISAIAKNIFVLLEI